MVAGLQFVKVIVFLGAVTVRTVTARPRETVMVGVVVVVESTVDVPVMVVGGAVEVIVDLWMLALGHLAREPSGRAYVTGSPSLSVLVRTG